MKNELRIGVILSYLSMFLTNMIGLVYTPYMLSKLGQAEYGLYTLSSSTVSYLSLLSFGFGSAYVRFYYRYRTQNEIHRISRLNGMFMQIFSIMSMMALIAGSVLVYNTERMFGASLSNAEIDKVRIIMMIMIVNVALTFPSSVLSSYVAANEKFIFQRVLNLVVSVGTPITMVILLAMGYKTILMSIVSLLWTILQFGVRFYYCINRLGMTFSFEGIDFSLLKEIGVFSFFIFLNSIVDTINWSVDKFLLGIYRGTLEVAVYGVASTFNTYFLTIATSISGVFAPRINSIVSKNDSDCDEKLSALFCKVGRIQFILLGLVLSGFCLFGKEFIILIWGGESYKAAYIMALLLMVPVIIPLCQNLGIEIQRAKNKHQFRSLVYIGIALCNVIISIPLCKLFGGVGCAAGTAISLIIGNVLIMNIFYQKKLGLDMIMYWKNMLSMLPPIAVCLIVGFTVKKYIPIVHRMHLFCGIGVYTILYSGLFYCIVMNTYEKDLVKGFIKKLRR